MHRHGVEHALDGALQVVHSSKGSSAMRCITSKVWPFSQRYS